MRTLCHRVVVGALLAPLVAVGAGVALTGSATAATTCTTATCEAITPADLDVVAAVDAWSAYLDASLAYEKAYTDFYDNGVGSQHHVDSLYSNQQYREDLAWQATVLAVEHPQSALSINWRPAHALLTNLVTYSVEYSNAQINYDAVVAEADKQNASLWEKESRLVGEIDSKNAEIAAAVARQEEIFKADPVSGKESPEYLALSDKVTKLIAEVESLEASLATTYSDIDKAEATQGVPEAYNRVIETQRMFLTSAANIADMSDEIDPLLGALDRKPSAQARAIVDAMSIRLGIPSSNTQTVPPAIINFAEALLKARKAGGAFTPVVLNVKRVGLAQRAQIAKLPKGAHVILSVPAKMPPKKVADLIGEAKYLSYPFEGVIFVDRTGAAPAGTVTIRPAT